MAFKVVNVDVLRTVYNIKNTFICVTSHLVPLPMSDKTGVPNSCKGYIFYINVFNPFIYKADMIGP